MFNFNLQILKNTINNSYHELEVGKGRKRLGKVAAHRSRHSPAHRAEHHQHHARPGSLDDGPVRLGVIKFY